MARLPAARVARRARGGHLFLLDQPEDAAPEIAAFLDVTARPLRQWSRPSSCVEIWPRISPPVFAVVWMLA